MKHYLISWYCLEGSSVMWLMQSAQVWTWLDRERKLQIVTTVVEAATENAAKDVVVKQYGLVTWRECREVPAGYCIVPDC